MPLSRLPPARSSPDCCRRLRLPNAWSTQKLLVWMWHDHWVELGGLASETVRRRRMAIQRARRRMAVLASRRARLLAGAPRTR